MVKRMSKTRRKPANGTAHKRANQKTCLKNSETLCAVSDRCGGCSCVNVSYEEQLKGKDEQIAELFSDVQFAQAEIRTILGMQDPLFYRDKGDEYVTRFSDFSFDFTTTTNFISQQKADGGGDYPEAVHTALEVGMQSLSWDRNARTKLAFLLLDAPAHQDQEGVIASLQKSVKLYAEKGIKIIPIAASGVDKNTEFMLRFFAVSTGGTYVFITNDSRIGNDHIAATVGEYQVELLNSLIIRLINKYTE